MYKYMELTENISILRFVKFVNFSVMLFIREGLFRNERTYLHIRKNDISC